MVARTGLSSKDFIAPTSFDFREGKCFKMGRTIGAVSFLQILAPELNDRMLADFLDMDSNITVNLHIRTIDQAQAIKRIKSKITDLDKMKIEEQKKAVRSGYDISHVKATVSDTSMSSGSISGEQHFSIAARGMRQSSIS